MKWCEKKPKQLKIATYFSFYLGFGLGLFGFGLNQIKQTTDVKVAVVQTSLFLDLNTWLFAPKLTLVCKEGIETAITKPHIL